MSGAALVNTVKEYADLSINVFSTVSVFWRCWAYRIGRPSPRPPPERGTAAVVYF